MPRCYGCGGLLVPVPDEGKGNAICSRCGWHFMVEGGLTTPEEMLSRIETLESQVEGIMDRESVCE